MPAPEQPPMVDEGLRQTQEPSTGPGMELETTATTILASVKEQVSAFFHEFSRRCGVNRCLLLSCSKITIAGSKSWCLVLVWYILWVRVLESEYKGLV